MPYAQFVDAAALTGLFVFSMPTPPPGIPANLKDGTVEEKLDAFFCRWGHWDKEGGRECK